MRTLASSLRLKLEHARAASEIKTKQKLFKPFDEISFKFQFRLDWLGKSLEETRVPESKNWTFKTVANFKVKIIPNLRKS